MQQNRETLARGGYDRRHGPLRSWIRKLRGVLGLGVVGATTGGLLGALYAAARSVRSVGAIVPESVLMGATVWGALGGFTAVGLATGLALLDDRIELRTLSLWHVGIGGGLVGALFAPAVLLAGIAGSAPMAAVLALTGVCAGLGALFSVSLVRVGKHGARLEDLQSANAVPSLPASGVE